MAKKRTRKAGKGKRHYSYSLRDVYYDYNLDYQGEDKLGQRKFSNLIDDMIDKLAKEILENKQTFKLKGGKGKFKMVKHKPDRTFRVHNIIPAKEMLLTAVSYTHLTLPTIYSV